METLGDFSSTLMIAFGDLSSPVSVTPINCRRGLVAILAVTMTSSQVALHYKIPLDALEQPSFTVA